jgi:HEAT repeat protein
LLNDEKVRESAFSALNEIGVGEESIESLKNLLNDERLIVRNCAIELLENIRN